MLLRKLWKKVTLKRAQKCPLGDHDYVPAQVRGKYTYVTGCQCDINYTIERVDALDRSHKHQSRWLDSQPLTDEQRIAAALESIAKSMQEQVQREKSPMSEMYRILGEDL